MKFAAIDIGSNAVRLAITRPLREDSKNTQFKTVEFTRLPLRLGDDVFNKNKIGKKKAELLSKSMQAFALLMDIYNVDYYKACATSAMRDAQNSDQIITNIQKQTGINIEIIAGKEESRLIQLAIMEKIPRKHHLLHIDVGGGSTELAYLCNGIVNQYESFNIGTVRMREGKVKDSEQKRMKNWLKELNKETNDELQAIGTGGNIVKINQLSGVKSNEFNHNRDFQSTLKMIKSMTKHERVYELKLNPDRAEVIEYAGDIVWNILKNCNIQEIMAPNMGLKDGIIRDLWNNYYESK
jgi:exopolyphosphatase/guanosine-5'-triphosphate,3'-diphosphate pyrophosphatase